MARTQAQWISKNGQHFDISQTSDLTLLFKPLGGLNADAQGIYVEGSISDLRPDVIARQTDNTLDPSATPTTGDRYIIEDSGNLHANFGTITGVENDDIVEYDGANFIITYDASTDSNSNALCWVNGTNEWYQFHGTSWHLHQGLSSLVAGNGLVIAAGQIDLVPDATTGGDITPVNVAANGVGVDVTLLDGDHLTVDFTPANYTPDMTPAEADDIDDLSAHLMGIDNKFDDIDATHLEQEVAQVGHGFTTSQVVRMSGGIWVLAQANSAVNAEAIGVVSEVIDVNTFVVVTHGKMTIGLAGLTADTVYYLDATVAGQLTTATTNTVGQVVKPILYAKSPTEAYVYDRMGIEVAASDPLPISQNHVITTGEVANGFFVLTQVPSSAILVTVTPVGGPQQVNADSTGRVATADFQILGASSDELHFNNNGLATGLSEELTAGHEIMVDYFY